ncbi:WD40 repeat [Nocardia amikacinitolerans]|uniref:WD40 repeat n=1 Tax=Nocardia amikacinitolerans TaxID=756689 RepID=A0A285LVH0_9NOCA|nr:hypothetical protein [Nocardia amikacinitolerans]SNY88898.1 WD40 repeat [Nocardia amikacinitolerans]
MTGIKVGDLFYQPVVEMHLDRFFVERPWLAEALTELLDEPDCRFVLLTGGPGSGKSSFASWLVEHEPSALRYFIRRDSMSRASAGDVRSVLLTLGHQFAVLHPEAFETDALRLVIEQQAGRVGQGGRMVGIKVDDLVVSPFAATSAVVTQRAGEIDGEVVAVQAGRIVADERLLDFENLQYLALLAPAIALARIRPETRVLVVIDGVDELRFLPGDQVANVLNWLAVCPELPANIRVVVTARPDRVLLSRFRGAQRRWLRELAISEESTEVDRDLRRYTSRVASVEPLLGAGLRAVDLVPERFLAKVAERADGSFQYARSVLRAILDASANERHGDLVALARLAELPGELNELYAFFLGLIRENAPTEVPVASDPERRDPAWAALYLPLLAAFALAQEPLTPNAAAELVGLSIAPEWIADAVQRLAQFLDEVDGGYQLYHESFGEFLESERTDPLLRVDSTHWHNRITARALRRFGGGAGWQTADAYLRRYLAVHAAAAGRLDELVLDAGFLVAAEPDVLLRELPLLRGAEAKAAGWVYEAAARRFSGRPVRERPGHLELVARQQRMDALTDGLAALDVERDLSVRWLRTWLWHPHHRLGRFGDAPPVAMAADPELDEIVLLGADGVVRTVDRVTGLVSRAFDLAAVVGTPVALNLGTAFGRIVAIVGAADGRVHVFDPVTGAPSVPPLSGRAGFDRLPRLVVAGRIASGSVTLGAPAELSAVAVADIDDHAYAVAGDLDGVVTVWDLATGEPRALLNPFVYGTPESFAFTSLDGVPAVVIGDQYGRLAVLHLGDVPADLGPDPIHEQEPEEVIAAFHNINACVAASVSGQTVVVTAGDDGVVRFWNPHDGSHVGDPIVVDAESLHALAVLPGDILAVGGRSLNLYALADRRRLATVPVPHDSATTVLATTRFRGDVALVSGGYDGVVNIWPVAELLSAATAEAPDLTTVYGVITGEVAGRAVVVSGGSDSNLRQWDVDSGEPIGAAISTGQGGIRCLASIASGANLLVAAGGFDNTIVLASFTPTGGAVVGTLTGHGRYIAALAFGWVGKRLMLASGSGDHTIRLWDVASHTCALTLAGHLGTVQAVMFLPPRRSMFFGTHPRLLSGGEDGALRLWDLRDGTQIGVPLVDPDGLLEDDTDPPPPDLPPDDSQWTREDFFIAAEDARSRADLAFWRAEKAKQMSGTAPDPVLMERMGGRYRPYLSFARIGAAENGPVYAATVSGIRVWDLEAGLAGAWIPLHPGAIDAIRVDELDGGHRLLAAGNRGELTLSYPGEGQPRVRFDTSGHLFAVGIHPADRRTLILGGVHGLMSIALTR